MKNILIIEDDRWLAEIYQDVLRKKFNVTLRRSAQEAIETLDEAKPDIILLDFMLPGGNGAAFLQELRSYDDMANVPVLICSSIGFSVQQKQSLQQFAPLLLMDKAELTPEKLTTVLEVSLC